MNTRPDHESAPKASAFPTAKRVRTPTVLQMEAVECGAAALGIVLGHYGRFVPLEELRAACGVSRDGSKASNVLRAARKYGMEASGYRRQLETLHTLPLPLIIFWNFNHFLVVEGYGNGRVYLNDPASGPRSVTEEEFDQAFTGIVLELKPGAEFQRGGRSPSLFHSLRQRFGDSHIALVFVVLVSLFGVIPGLVIPTFTRVFIDDVLVANLNDRIVPLLLGLAITALLQGVLTLMQQYYLLRLESKLALSTASKFFWHVLRLPIEFFNQRATSEIGNRVLINDRVARLLSGELATTVLNVILIVFFAILMWQYDWILTLVGVVIATLNLVALQWVARYRKDGNQRLQQERGKLMGTAYVGLQLIETLKATGSESDFFARWSGFLAKVMNAEQGLGRTTQYLNVVPPLLVGINTTAILVIGGLRVMEGQMTMGMLVAFQALMMSFLSPVNQIVNLGSRIQDAQADMNRLDDVLKYPIDPQVDVVTTAVNQDGTSPLVNAKLLGQVELRNITFGYSPLDPPLITNFNLFIKPGMRIALVGGSGSGKSTVAKLVSGLYQAWEGEILLDEKPRAQVPRHILTNSISVVDQDIHLFEGTVRDNLTLWDDNVPEHIVTQAAKDAHIHSEITNRPNGYDYRVEEGGRNFSGGQRQRLEIARALVTNPTVLILDEATSALDPVTEMVIDSHLRRRGCTCLIIAHRLSTIRDCDEILVLERGKVVQRGTHDQLRYLPGPYNRLIKAEGNESASNLESILEALF